LGKTSPKVTIYLTINQNIDALSPNSKRRF
jgi:hypothetical protein